MFCLMNFTKDEIYIRKSHHKRFDQTSHFSRIVKSFYEYGLGVCVSKTKSRKVHPGLVSLKIFERSPKLKVFSNSW